MKLLRVLAMAGALNPNVNQANIAATICMHGWTATVRPPVSYTESLKRQQMKALGITANPKLYEEDHFIPLELGGHPTSPDNLWPQIWAWTDPCSAHRKDVDENALRRDVCSGKMTLAAAQQAMSDRWATCKKP